MVGAGHVVFQGKTQDYGYLRLETRAEWRLLRFDLVGQEGGRVQADRRPPSTTRTRSSPSSTLSMNFRNASYIAAGSEGWLYATVEGKVNGEEKKVIYPMRRVDCQSGALIRN